MNINWITKVLLLSCLVTITGWSQGSKKPLSLHDCIRIALEKNVNIQINENTAHIADYNHKASFSRILPTIFTSYSGSRTRTGDGTTQQDVPITIIDTLTGAPRIIGFENQEVTNPGFKRNSYNFTFGINQNIFDGGAWWNGIKQSKVNKTAAHHNLNKQVNSIVTTVAQNYLDLLKQEKLLEVNQLAVQRSQDNLERSEKMYEIGSIAKVDVFRARVNLGNDRISFINQRNTVDQTRQTLNISLGREPGELIEIEKTVNFNYTLLPLDGLLETAYQNQPELKRLEMEIRSSELGVALTKSVFLPNISGFFRYSRNNTLPEKIYQDLNQNWNVTIGLSGSFNLFNGFQDQVNHQNSKINLKNSRLELQDYKRALKSRITTMYQNYNDFLEIIEINKENLEASREEYRLASERYRLGAGTSLDLREAQVNLTEAERILVAAQYNLIITYAQLQDLLGNVQNALNF